MGSVCIDVQLWFDSAFLLEAEEEFLVAFGSFDGGGGLAVEGCAFKVV